MKRILAYLLIFSTVLHTSCDRSGDTQKQRFLIRGNVALKEQNYHEAQRLYQEALKLDSCYSPVLNNLGILRFEQKQYIQAILAYDAAIACNPEDYEALLNRTNAYYETNQLFRAEDDLQYLLRTYPDSSTIYFRLGLVNARLHRYNAAVNQFTQSLELDSGNIEALINRGSTYYYLGKYQQAENDLLTALDANVQEGNVHNALALVEIDKGNLDAALSEIEEALRIEPLQPYFLNNRGYIYLLKGDLEQAREDIDRSITLDPENGWAYRNKGRWYHLNQQYDDALRLYKLALTKDTFIRNIYIFTGDTYLALGEMELACEAFNEALSANEKEALGRLENCD